MSNAQNPKPANQPSPTPGPWDYTEDMHGLTVVDERLANPIARLDHYTDRNVANARLLAAAPEMLEMLKRAYWALLDLPETDHSKHIANEIRAAIAKATGGAQ